MRAEAAPPRVVGADRPQLGRALPGRVHQPGQRPPQRCREGTGPTHARNGRWCRPTPSSRVRPPICNGALGYTSSRAAPPTGRWLRARCRLRRSARSTAANSCSSPRSARPGSPAATAPERQAPRAAGTGEGQARRRTPQPAVVDTKLRQRRHRAHGALADRRERQAGHAELDLQPRPARPRARGLRQPGQRGARRRRGRCSSARPPAPSRSRRTGWATTRAWVDGSSCRPTSSRPRSRPRPSSRPASAR